MNPGVTYFPRASMTCLAVASAAIGPTSTIRSPTIATSAQRQGEPVPSNSCPPRISTSYVSPEAFEQISPKPSTKLWSFAQQNLVFHFGCRNARDGAEPSGWDILANVICQWNASEHGLCHDSLRYLQNHDRMPRACARDTRSKKKDSRSVRCTTGHV